MRIGALVGFTVLVLAGVGLAMAAYLARYTFLVVTVRGISMEPTLHDGDRILVRRKSAASIRRGEIAVVMAGIDPPGHLGYAVKRVAALPGEIVPPAGFDSATGIEPGATVPAQSVVLIGDNRDHSHDSRQRGFYHATTILGTMVRKMP